MEDKQFECIDLRVGEQLSLFAAGDLTEEERARFEGHLAACLACAERERDMHGLLGAINALRAGRETAAAARSEDEPLRKRGVSRWLPIGVGGIIAAAGLVAAILIAKEEPESALRARVHTLEGRLARLETQNDALVAAVASSAAAGGSTVHEIRDRPFIYPPNL